ncbi:MAG: aminotransferase class V-fold PLP-dependent enzyme [Planctomycetaceae bacterium]|nr:aminotransferase class V-fold PLP-dependent enzyme [Planctomycetaceae bacterium]
MNKVREGETPLDALYRGTAEEGHVPEGFVDYESAPREYRLNSISTAINIDTRIADLYSSPYDQVNEQIRLAVESLKERQESQLVNSDDYGLLKNVADSQKIKSISGSPTPDDFDELIPKVWKEPSFFLAHPRADAVLKVIPVDHNGELLLHEYTTLLKSGRAKLVAVTQVSNAIGTVTPTE